MKNLKIYNNIDLLGNPEIVEKNVDGYLSKEDISIDEYNKIVNLYSNYKVFFPLFEKYGKKRGRRILDLYEEEIFTINGNVLDDEERINLVLNELSAKLENSEEFEKYSKALEAIRNLKNSELDYKFIKKKISLLEASLGYNNKFLNSSYDAFVDCYRGVLLNSIKFDYDEIYYDEIKFKRGL